MKRQWLELQWLVVRNFADRWLMTVEILERYGAYV